MARMLLNVSTIVFFTVHTYTCTCTLDLMYYNMNSVCVLQINVQSCTCIYVHVHVHVGVVNQEHMRAQTELIAFHWHLGSMEVANNLERTLLTWVITCLPKTLRCLFGYMNRVPTLGFAPMLDPHMITISL